MMKRWVFILVCGALAACSAEAPPTAPTSTAAATPPPPAALPIRKAAPAGASAYFIEPADGASVQSPVRIVFGLKGIGVAPAGTDRADVGHHHLLIDAPLPTDLGLPIPNDEQHRHFGGGQTEVELALPPGRHTLQLLLGDNLHIPFDPPIVSNRITVEVR